MKILQVSHSFPPDESGVGEVVWQLSRHLVARGHTVHVATGVRPSVPASECIGGIHVHRFAVSGASLVGTEGDREGYLKFLETGPWDVIVFHNLQGWPIELALPLMPSFRIPFVVISHGTFHLKAVLPWRGAISGLRHKRAADYRVALATAMRSVSAFVVLSPELRRDPLLTELGIAEPTVIRNGVELPPPEDPMRIRAKLGIGDRPWVVTVSRHSRVKNHGAFFQIARALRTEIPDVQTSIIGAHYAAASWRLGRIGIAGGCWYECKLGALRHPYVHLLSRLPRPDVLSAIAASSVLVLTSHHEASPLVLLEAMAASVPWVSVDVGCVRDYAGGEVVENTADIPQVVTALMKNPERRAHLGALGRRAAETIHSWNAIASQHESLYSSLCCEVV
jgi:glycosyltransferase involved in cell wall biosynthesis